MPRRRTAFWQTPSSDGYTTGRSGCARSIRQATGEFVRPTPRRTALTAPAKITTCHAVASVGHDVCVSSQYRA